MEAVAHDMLQPYCTPASLTEKSCPQNCCSCCCKDCNDQSSTTSTPYVSAPSSPGRRNNTLGYYFSKSALTTSTNSELLVHDVDDTVSMGMEAESTPPFPPAASEFDFSARFSEADSWLSPSVASTMSSAEDLFYNGKIRPLNLSDYRICFNSAADDGCCSPSAGDPHVLNARCQYGCIGVESQSPYTEHNYHHYQQQLLRRQRLELTKPASPLSALEQWKKSMGKYDKGQAQAHHIERGMQISSLPLAWHSNYGGGGHHRRARSLSPLRVFHMDDMIQPRVSFESETYTCMTSSHGGVDHAVGITRPRRTRKSWTLKELLNMGDNKVHDRRPLFGGKYNNFEPSSLQYEDSKNGDNQLVENVEPAKSGENGAIVRRLEEKGSLKSAGVEMGKRSLAEERKYRKSSTHSEGGRPPWMQQKAMLGHKEHYFNGSERGNAEEMKRRTFLPYKKSLLGCLGFTSKISSMKGLHAMNSNRR